MQKAVLLIADLLLKKKAYADDANAANANNDSPRTSVQKIMKSQSSSEMEPANLSPAKRFSKDFFSRARNVQLNRNRLKPSPHALNLLCGEPTKMKSKAARSASSSWRNSRNLTTSPMSDSPASTKSSRTRNNLLTQSRPCEN